MTERGLRVELLSQNHDRAGFSSGNDDLDRYFREQAGQDQKRRLSAVFVLHDVANDIVAGYYTLPLARLNQALYPMKSQSGYLAGHCPRHSSGGLPPICGIAARGWVECFLSTR